MGEWRTATVGDVALRVTKGTTPTTIGGRFVDDGINFVKVESVTDDGRIDASKLAHVDEATNDLLSRSILCANDVLFTIAGTIGRVALISSTVLPANTNQAVAIIRPNEDLVDPRFLYYVLQDGLRLRHANSRVVQSVQANFSLGELRTLSIPMPDIAEQRAIAHVLGSLDDKIDLNRRMNETLEAIARALFKSWFVDFDPVHAKAEGRDPTLPKPIADLFPDRFHASELGDIPDRWSVRELREIAEVIDCLHSKKPQRTGVGSPLLQLQNIRDDGLLDMTDTFLIDEVQYATWTSRMEAGPGDCVITNVGRVGAAAQVPEGLRAALGRNMTGIRTRTEFRFPTFLIETLLSDAMRREIVRKTDTGTILDALNVRNISKLRLVVPPIELAKTFEESCRPLRAQMERGLEESRTLAATRDALAPKLTSGEIRVPDAARMLEAAPV